MTDDNAFISSIPAYGNELDLINDPNVPVLERMEAAYRRGIEIEGVSCQPGLEMYLRPPEWAGPDTPEQIQCFACLIGTVIAGIIGTQAALNKRLGAGSFSAYRALFWALDLQFDAYDLVLESPLYRFTMLMERKFEAEGWSPETIFAWAKQHPQKPAGW